MAYDAKDGRRFANHQMGRHYDNVRNPEAAHEAKQAEEPETGEEEPIESVVQAHGPAHTTHIHREDDGSHSVESEHEDGHKHKSHGHAHVHAAHEHSLKAHGAEEQEEEQEPESEREAEGEEAPIPGMR